jgi:hypothetical protein
MRKLWSRLFQRPMRTVSTEPSTHSNVAIPPATESTCRDSWRQPWTLPSLVPLGWDQGSRAAVAHGSHHAASLVACSTWEMKRRGAINGLCDREREE